MLAIWLKYIVSFPDPHVHQGRAGAGHETVTIIQMLRYGVLCVIIKLIWHKLWQLHTHVQTHTHKKIRLHVRKHAQNNIHKHTIHKKVLNVQDKQTTCMG